MATIFCLLASAFVVMNASTAMTGTSPPASGDWTITTATVLTEETKEMTGNIIIESGGSLTLDGTTLKFKCDTDGKYGIDVKSGGSLVIKGSSTLTKSGAKNYTVICETGASAHIMNSDVQYCGYMNNAQKYTGLYFQCDAVIENTTISHCFRGVCVEDSTVIVKYCTISDSYYHNIAGWNAKLITIDHNIVKNIPNSGRKCNLEFMAGTTAKITNNQISYGGHNNIWADTEGGKKITLDIEGNTIWGANYNGIWLNGYIDATVLKNTIYKNTLDGIWFTGTKIVCNENTIKDNGNLSHPNWVAQTTATGGSMYFGHGFAGFNCNVVFNGNTVGNNYGHNFETTNSTVDFENNNFYASIAKCNVEFFDRSVVTAKNNVINGAGHNCFWMSGNVKVTIDGCTMKNSPHNGVWAADGCEVTVKNCIIDTCAEDGIYTSNCTLTVTNTNIKNCQWWGIRTEGGTVTENGNTIDSSTCPKGTTSKNYWVQLRTVNDKGATLGLADVTVKNAQGTVVWTGKTDAGTGLTNMMMLESGTQYTVDSKAGDSEASMKFSPAQTGAVDVTLKEENEKTDYTMIYIAVALILVIVIIVVVVVIMKGQKKDQDVEIEDEPNEKPKKSEKKGKTEDKNAAKGYKNGSKKGK